MAIIFMLSIGSICTTSCTIEATTKLPDKAIIEKAMKLQQDSWNSGDIDGFMKWYWKSDSLKFVSKKGVSFGWNKVLNNYKKSYPTKEKMGTLVFDLKEIKPIDEAHIIVVGSWDLTYPDNPNVGGYFTLLWELKPAGWRIVMDHTS